MRPFIFFLFSFLLFATDLCANATPVNFTKGAGTIGLVEIEKSDQIALSSEKLDLGLYPYNCKGRVHYVLRNDGPAVTVKLGFPVVVPNSDRKDIGEVKEELALYKIRLNGKEASFIKRYGKGTLTKKNSPFLNLSSVVPEEMRSKLEVGHGGGYGDDYDTDFRYLFYVTEVPFEAGKEVIVDIDFISNNKIVRGDHWAGKFKIVSTGYSYFSYLLTPASNWKGNVGRMDISLKINGYPIEGDTLKLEPVVFPKKYQKDGYNYSWHFENDKPAEDIRILLEFSIPFKSRKVDYLLDAEFLERMPKAPEGGDVSGSTRKNAEGSR